MIFILLLLVFPKIFHCICITIRYFTSEILVKFQERKKTKVIFHCSSITAFYSYRYIIFIQ